MANSGNDWGQTLPQHISSIDSSKIMKDHNKSAFTGAWTSDSQRQHQQPTSAFTQSIISDRKRGSHTSAMSDSFYGGNITAARIPWADQAPHADHLLTDMVKTGQFSFHDRDDHISDYKLGLKTPMSPVKRQQLTLNQIKLMGMQATRGSTRPSAKEFAEQLAL